MRGGGRENFSVTERKRKGWGTSQKNTFRITEVTYAEKNDPVGMDVVKRLFDSWGFSANSNFDVLRHLTFVFL